MNLLLVFSHDIITNYNLDIETVEALTTVSAYTYTGANGFITETKNKAG